MESQNQPRSEARERILKSAARLFFSQGFQATGINQIIEESGVAKATFYAHFPSKDDLCLAYLKGLHDQELSLIRTELAKRRTPLSRYLAPLEILEPWLVETEFRGCPFLNIASEIPEGRSPLRKVGQDFYRMHAEVVESAVKELRDSDRKKYGHLDPTLVAKKYMTIFVGAIGLCEIFQSLDPLKEGLKMVKALVGE